MRSDPNLIDPRGPWKLTFPTRTKFFLVDPKPEMVHFDDIAWALSRQCRFDGMVDAKLYSVAEHSVAVARRVRELGGTPVQQRQALMHDAAETYVGDASSPLKAAMRLMSGFSMSDYDLVEALVWDAVAKRFDLPHAMHPLVKQADAELVALEGSTLLGPLPDGWGPEPTVLLDDSYKPRCWDPWLAEAEFRDAWEQLC